MDAIRTPRAGTTASSQFGASGAATNDSWPAWFALQAKTAAQAQTELRNLMTVRQDQALRRVGLTPKFSDYCAISIRPETNPAATVS